MAVRICDTVTDENGIEISEHGTVAFPAACYVHELSGKEIPWHWHEEFEALLVKEGIASVRIGKEKLRLSAGNGIFINSGTLHSVVSDWGGLCLLQSVCWHPRLTGGRDDSVFWQKYTQDLLKEHAVPYLFFNELGEKGTEAVLYFSDALEKAVKEPVGFEFDIRHDLSRLLVFGYQKQKSDRLKQSEKELRTERRMKQMMTFIQKNYHQQITIDEIAESAGISVSECLRCFRNIFGTTPIRYTRQFRLERAAGMLRRGSSVSECSELCGFEDMSYFAREFKKQFGCRPMEYKKEYKKKAKGI